MDNHRRTDSGLIYDGRGMEGQLGEQIPIEKQFLRGKHNLNFRVKQVRSFLPSIRARQSYLYLQAIGRMEAEAAYYSKREGMDSFLLVLTQVGRGHLTYEGQEYDLETGDGFLIDCRRLHYYGSAAPEGWNFTFLHIDGGTMFELFSQFARQGTVMFSLNRSSPVPGLLEEVFQSQEKPRDWTELVTHRLLTDLITELIIAGDQSGMTSATTASFIEDARAFLEEHYVEEIHLDRLSALLGVSKFHLAREFKKATGQAPNEYLITIRINHSKDLLKYTSYSIAQISEMVGVPNTNHFLYLFKSREGTTPSAFRKLWKSK